MTIASPLPPDLLARIRGHRLEVRWSAAVTTWTDRFGVCPPHGPRHGRADLAVSIEPLEAGRAIIEAWLEFAGQRRSVLPSRPATCQHSLHGGLLHLDVTADGDRLIAVTFDLDADRLLYATSTLPARAGGATGAFDPPTARRRVAGREAASA